MSKSKKTTPTTPAPHDGKGFLVLAGEAFSVLGEEIVEGKDKVVEVAGNKISALKTAISNITHKKKAPAKKVAKKVVKKAPKKVAKRAPAKKVAKKAAAPKKVVAKKAAAPKKVAAKKSAPKKVAKKAGKKASPAKKKK